MLQKWNKPVQRLLWGLVILGMIASLPLIANRLNVEQSSKGVEIVFDYTDLLTIAKFESNPEPFIADKLVELKQSGVTTLALYENSLTDFQNQHLLKVYSQEQVTDMFGDPRIEATQSTYVLFKDEASYERLLPVIEEAFGNRGIDTRPWEWPNGTPGLIIEETLESARIVPMAPDFQLVSDLQSAGFEIVMRLSDDRMLDTAQLEQLVQKLARYEIDWIVFGGDAVTGYQGEAEQGTLTSLATFMAQYGVGFGLIETDPSKPGQKGTEKLAYLTDYEVVRLHSIMERETSQSAKRLADRIVLAVEDRNIRMIYLNADVSRDIDNATYKNTLENLQTALSGEHGAVKRLESAGFELGQAEPFEGQSSKWDKPLKLILLIGGIALISLLAGSFFSVLALPVFMIGLVGTAGLYVLSSKLLLQAMALGVGIAAPSLSVILIMRSLQMNREHHGQSSGNRSSASIYVQAFIKFLIACMLTGTAFFYMAGLLSGMTYWLRIDLFRGVSLLKLAPIAIVGVYYVGFAHQRGTAQTMTQLKRILFANIKVIYVVAAGLLGVVILYYLSRAGNAGQTLPFEMQFRTFLENTLQVRPRTQEFLIAHPLFIFAAYMVMKYRSGLYLFVFAVIGQLSMVNTFTHLHTPLHISAIRVGYGMLLGALVSLLLILAWELIVVKGWKQWKLKLGES
ncbi:DUF5693 family protein [Marinicrinis sediminis]|uniref:DUF5693 family protein n=1 Tax=Marinicrinis sediminis TaxID=1652465 RepID=A0ABW5RAF8_9BACL